MNIVSPGKPRGPVKAETAGSNPVGTAMHPSGGARGRGGRVRLKATVSKPFMGHWPIESSNLPLPANPSGLARGVAFPRHLPSRQSGDQSRDLIGEIAKDWHGQEEPQKDGKRSHLDHITQRERIHPSTMAARSG